MKNIYNARLLEDRVVNLLSSRNVMTGDVFRTFLIRFPKILLQELNTHRVLVRNCASSRAMPTKVFIRNVEEDPYIPEFTHLQAGMVGAVIEDAETIDNALTEWLSAKDSMIAHSKRLHNMNVHKQDTNRLLEPFTHVDVLLSGTEWDNFLKLRTAPDAQLGFKAIADKIQELILTDKPVDLNPGEWHIPFQEIHYEQCLTIDERILVAIARAARVSYTKHGSDEIDLDSDKELANKLLKSGHLTPLEHICKAVDTTNIGKDAYTSILDPKLQPFIYWDADAGYFRWTRQYAGFYTYRHHIEDNVNIQ